jgi:choline dehydrogenase-like flavoprotein
MRQVQTSICIIGAGAAGGILAYRLASAGRDVLILEQGAFITDDYFTNGLPPAQDEHFGVSPERSWDSPPSDIFFDANAQARRLYASADIASISPEAATVFCNRQIFRLNGKQNLWGGVALRMSPRDFRARDFGDGDLNWPIDYDDLAPHYTEIERLIGVCGTREELDDLPDGDFLPPLPLRRLDLAMQSAVRRMGRASLRAIPARKAIETRPDAPNVCLQCGHCVHGCRTGSIYKFSSRLLPLIVNRRNFRTAYETKVLRLRRASDSSRIEAAECLDTSNQERFEVLAGTFIVAAGALETARLLLNSDNDACPAGVANSSGLVGCYLQDHVRARASGSLWWLGGSKRADPPGIGDHLLIPRFLSGADKFRGGFQIQCGHMLPWLPFYLDGMAAFPARLKDLLARWLFATYVGLFFMGKPSVRIGNRVRRSSKCDRYGAPQVDVDYAWSNEDLEMQASMQEWGAKILHAAFAIGVTTAPDTLPGLAIHYAGVCRMAASPRDGVVNSDCRSFDHPNLYICDGGVMPDLSEKNPTLTIMALANRLAATLLSNRGMDQ